MKFWKERRNSLKGHTGEMKRDFLLANVFSRIMNTFEQVPRIALYCERIAFDLRNNLMDVLPTGFRV